MKILFLGDVFGKPGRNLVADQLPYLREEFHIDFCIANGENIAQGRGLTEKTANALFNAGVDLLTSGNHLWDQQGVKDYLPREPRILKPMNYPEQALGTDVYFFQSEGTPVLAVFCLIGQAFMGAANSPFETAARILPDIQERTHSIIVDIHAEATAEKRALAHFLNGSVSAVIGTHTHIQTADEEILPGGTAYITDVGMTGPHDSVIGIRKEIILEKMTTGMPIRYEVAEEGLQINAVLIDIDSDTGKALSILRIRRKVTE